MNVSLQQKNSMYYAVFRATDGAGKTKQKWVSTGIPTQRGNKRTAQKEAQRIADEYEKAAQEAQKRTCPDVLFVEWIRLWLTQKGLELDQVTMLSYKNIFETHIEPWFTEHNKPLYEINVQDLQDYYNEKAAPSSGKGLSGVTLRKHQVIISGALKEAAARQYIPSNPASFVKLPKKQKFVGNYYTEEQATTLLKAVQGTPIEEIVTVTLFYGLRRSEACGLKWSAVNLDSGTFTICSTVVYADSLTIEKDRTKNESSYRTYPMTPEIKELFCAIKERQENNKRLFGDQYIDSGHVFTWEDGRMLAPDYVSKKFWKILDANGLPHIRFHDLRHTTASLLVANGYDLQHVADWLGHSDISTTANIYAHLDFKSKEGTASTMASLLSGKC